MAEKDVLEIPVNQFLLMWKKFHGSNIWAHCVVYLANGETTLMAEVYHGLKELKGLLENSIANPSFFHFKIRKCERL